MYKRKRNRVRYFASGGGWDPASMGGYGKPNPTGILQGSTEALQIGLNNENLGRNSPDYIRDSKSQGFIDSAGTIAGSAGLPGSQYAQVGNMAGDTAQQLIGTRTGAYGIEYDKAGADIIGTGLKGAGTGAAIGSVAGPYGSAIGAGVGLIGGAVAGGISNEKEQAQARELMQKEFERRNDKINEDSELYFNRINQPSNIPYAMKGAKLKKKYFQPGGMIPAEVGGKPMGPDHEEGGLPIVDPQTGEAVAEVEGNERIFSQDDTAAIEQMVASIMQAQDPSQQQAMAAELGMAVAQMVQQQEVAQAEQEMEMASQEQEMAPMMSEMGPGSPVPMEEDPMVVDDEMMMAMGGKLKKKLKYEEGGRYTKDQEDATAQVRQFIPMLAKALKNFRYGKKTGQKEGPRVSPASTGNKREQRAVNFVNDFKDRGYQAQTDPETGRVVITDEDGTGVKNLGRRKSEAYLSAVENNAQMEKDMAGRQALDYPGQRGSSQGNAIEFLTSQGRTPEQAYDELLEQGFSSEEIAVMLDEVMGDRPTTPAPQGTVERGPTTRTEVATGGNKNPMSVRSGNNALSVVPGTQEEVSANAQPQQSPSNAQPQQSSQGDQTVMNMQEVLNELLGTKLAVDGKWGRNTQAAFQELMNIRSAYGQEYGTPESVKEYLLGMIHGKQL